jgi:general secretion pathway protein D
MLSSSSLFSADIQLALQGKLPVKHTKNGHTDISFIYDKEPIIDIINALAARKRVNVVLPTGNDALKMTVTIRIEQRLTLDQAWDILLSILDVAGYAMVENEGLYVIIKNDAPKKNISREPLPLYINTPYNELPETNERIRYIYYLSNLKAVSGPTPELQELITTYLPTETVSKLDKDSNSILVSGPAKNIRSLFKIIAALDQAEFQERLEIIRLRYTDSDTIAKLFTESILATAAPSGVQRFRIESAKEEPSSYFSRNVKVISEPRNNALIVIGRTQAVERVREFILKYIDTQLDSGKSILHTYALQYLDAATFAPILDRIVQGSRTGGTGQSSSQDGKQAGAERLFDEVIIRADSPTGASAEGTQGKFFGGNNLVVAARNDDWKRIKRLIEQLDRPQPQVIIEVLIADLTLEDTRALGTLLRNAQDLPFPGNASAQSAMLGPQVILDLPNNNNPDTDLSSSSLTGVNSDLNADNVPATSGSTTTYVPMAATLQPGAMVVSISDPSGRTWAIADILQSFTSMQILSHPHVITINNQEATISSGQTRLVDDQAASSTSGITRRKIPLKANTTVTMQPRISSANTVNLQLTIKIDEFTGTNIPSGADAAQASNGDRITRTIISNATVKSGDILAIGGLIREALTDSMVKTPVLADIPILGWLFKNKLKDLIKTSVTVFICPTIVMPKFRGGINEYTKTYVGIAKKNSAQESLFDTNRDPITRVFFNTQGAGGELITQQFVDKDEVNYVPHDIPEDILSMAEKENKMLDEVQGKIVDAAGNLERLTTPTSLPTERKPIVEEHVITAQRRRTLQELLQNEGNPLLT